MLSDADLYSRLLLTQGLGYPLSRPQPVDNFPRKEGVKIGDVGVITSNGSFHVFFNVCRRDDPVNRFGLPDAFEAVHLALDGADVAFRPFYHRAGSHVSNSTICKRRTDRDPSAYDNAFVPVAPGTAVTVTFTHSKPTAVLLLPDGASRVDLRFLNVFRDCALKHAERWYAFLRRLGCEVGNGDLYLITGVDKTKSWSLAAIEKRTEDNNIISLTLNDSATRDACHWEWDCEADIFLDSGPRRQLAGECDVENQTVFLRGFRIAIRSLPFSSAKRYHPADAINRELLAVSYAPVAITHDDEWCSVLEDNDEEIPENAELVRRVFTKYAVHCRSGGTYLTPSNKPLFERPSSNSPAPSISSRASPSPWTMDRKLLNAPCHRNRSDAIFIDSGEDEESSEARSVSIEQGQDDRRDVGTFSSRSSRHPYNTSPLDERTAKRRNADAQARHRDKIRAHVQQLEENVTKLQIAMRLAGAPSPVLLVVNNDDDPLPPLLARIRELERDNAFLSKQNDTLRALLRSNGLVVMRR